MEIETAFKLLGLPTSASPEEIKKAYRQLSRETHPDTVAGTEEGQVSLNAAYERALAYSRISDAVVPIGRDALVREIRHIVGGGANAREKARARLRRRHRPIQWLKWLAWIAGGVASALAFAGESLGFLPWPEQDSAALERALALYSAVFGLTGLALHGLVSWNTRRLEAYVDSLASRRQCAAELAEALAYEDKSIVSEEDVRPGSARATQHSSANELPVPLSNYLLGAADFGPVLVAKAVEHGLLRPLDQQELTPDSMEKYQVSYRPSLFRPPPLSAPAPTVAGARAQGGCGALGVLLTGAATFYLGAMKTSWWAVVPGVFIVSTAMLMVTGFMEARRLARQGGANDAAQEPKAGV